MKLSELIVTLTAVLAATGDIKVFIGDMKPLNDGHIDVADASSDNPDARKLYSDKFLHLGEW